MNKKKIIILSSIIGVIVISIVGTIIYFNSPNYIFNQYIKYFNNREYDKMEKLEYNYERYDTHKVYDIDYISILDYSFWSKGDDDEFIYEYTTHMYENQDVPPSDVHISSVYIYTITYKNGSDLTRHSLIVLGKVHGKIKVVYSPFYSLW